MNDMLSQSIIMRQEHLRNELERLDKELEQLRQQQKRAQPEVLFTVYDAPMPPYTHPLHPDGPGWIWWRRSELDAIERHVRAYAVEAVGAYVTHMDSTQVKQYFSHNKSGNVYELVALAKTEAYLARVAVYRSCLDGETWVRPATEFQAKFTRCDAPSKETP